MPTYNHKKTQQRVFFIHIPRTGGRFIEYNLKKNGFELDELDEWDCRRSVECAHFTKKIYHEYLNIDGIPSFSVIRNPLDRFVSLKSKEIYPKEWVFDRGALGWYRPMVDYLEPHNNLWRFEDGFGDEFAEWMSNLLNMRFKLYQPPMYLKVGEPYTKHSQLEYMHPNYRKIEVTPDIERYVKEEYHEDYQRYYPEV
tara:strand:- start:255 stop:845 length:591 start_codon:yes stop_codon:yes gene_type:complete